MYTPQIAADQHGNQRLVDDRMPELQSDGTCLMRDKNTEVAYNIASGEESAPKMDMKSRNARRLFFITHADFL